MARLLINSDRNTDGIRGDECRKFVKLSEKPLHDHETFKVLIFLENGKVKPDSSKG